MKGLGKTILALGMIIAFASNLHAGAKAISVNELEQLQKHGVTIIDIRKEKEIQVTGLIPTSYKLNFYKTNGKIDQDKWSHKFINLVKETDIKFVLVSTDGKQAKKGAEILSSKKGYSNSYYLEGGIDNWMAENGRTIR